MILTITAALVVFIYLALRLRGNRRQRGLPHPPGPQPRPVIGNLLDVPTVEPWVTYTQWEKKYGDIMSMQVLGTFIVILQSPSAARDLLDKHSAIYSDRPVLPFFQMMDLDWAIPLARFTERWRRGRRILERGLRPSMTALYHPTQKAKVHLFLKHLLERPERFREHIEHLQGAILMAITYGYDVKEGEDRLLEKARALVALAAATVMPGALLVNDMPFLRYLPEWLPGMGFKVLARNGRALSKDVIHEPFAFVKGTIESGMAALSMAREILAEHPEPESQDHIAMALGSLYSDTTVSTLLSFFLALLKYPAVQEKAQAELDAVTGGHRLPDYEDRPRLPYINALCMELLRWRMVAPLVDDVYRGYFIPKGAIVLANPWAALHDPAVYPAPDTFNPERFLTPDGHVKDDPLLTTVFGFGKRICPGRHVVDETLFIVVAYVLATFDVRHARDADGNPVPADPAYMGMQTSKPEPFECSITPRSKAAEVLIAAND
ncbi:cytochrome P450 [Artomyces pyxidatus]|uniref:Cytochrome P450 n=1 Tax=Artomyces pyxidatus TaxID=48021 RepID=A0ACB8SNV8_9AGAM|nr:cytochrome P450 [Artomyces pyxidatus]